MKETIARIKKVRVKVALLAFTSVVVFSFITAAISPMLTSTANAATPDDILNRARAWSILNAVIEKMPSHAPASSTNEEIDSCRFLQDPGSIYVGAAATGNNDDESWDAITENTATLNGALSSVGIQNGCRGLLTLLGYTITTSGMNKPNGLTSDSIRQKIQGALVQNAFFGATLGNDSPGDGLAYALIIYNLKNVCGWQFRNPYVANDKANTQEGARNREAQNNGATGEEEGQHYHTWTYENGGPGDNTYYRDGGTDNDVYVGSHSGFASSANDTQVDCGDNNAGTFGAILADNHKFAEAYARLVGSDGTTDAGSGTSNNEGEDAAKKSTCAIQAIGWLLCPILNTMAKIVDGAYYIVAGMLEVQPLATTGATENIYTSWQLMRNFANIAFVIAFLFIVFSQVTNVGISNYGIKKMLPRLVIAAILVNASYWICAIFVDLSNILGGSLNGLLHGIADNVKLTNELFSGNNNGWETITGQILAATAIGVGALFITLSALIPALVACLLVIVGIFLLLIIRQAFIILLIVISPLAFVAYLLPNTESLFRRWRELFQTLLLMYPIISLLFGACWLASKVLMAASQ